MTQIQSSIIYEVCNLLLVDRKYSQEVEYFYYSEICIHTIYNQVNRYKIQLTYYLYRNNMTEYDKMSYYKVIYTISTLTVYIILIIYKLTIEDIYDRLNSNSHLYRQYIIRVKYSTQVSLLYSKLKTYRIIYGYLIMTETYII